MLPVMSYTNVHWTLAAKNESRKHAFALQCYFLDELVRENRREVNQENVVLTLIDK